MPKKPKYQTKRPAPLDPGKISRKQIDFTKAFNDLVKDLVAARNWGNARAKLVRTTRLDDPSIDGARLHTVPLAHILRRFIVPFMDGAYDAKLTSAFIDFMAALIEAAHLTQSEVNNFKKRHPFDIQYQGLIDSILKRVAKNVGTLTAAYFAVAKALASGGVVSRALLVSLGRAINNSIGNVYAIGAQGPNNLVSDRGHPNAIETDSGNHWSLTPRSRMLFGALRVRDDLSLPTTSDRLFFATTPRRSRLVMQYGTVSFDDLTPRSRGLVGFGLTNAPLEPVNLDSDAVDWLRDFLDPVVATMWANQRRSVTNNNNANDNSNNDNNINAVNYGNNNNNNTGNNNINHFNNINTSSYVGNIITTGVISINNNNTLASSSRSNNGTLSSLKRKSPSDSEKAPFDTSSSSSSKVARKDSTSSSLTNDQAEPFSTSSLPDSALQPAQDPFASAQSTSNQDPFDPATSASRNAGEDETASDSDVLMDAAI